MNRDEERTSSAACDPVLLQIQTGGNAQCGSIHGESGMYGHLDTLHTENSKQASGGVKTNAQQDPDISSPTVAPWLATFIESASALLVCTSPTSPIKEGDVVEAQRRRIVFMLLKGKIYGLPGSDGTVSHIGGRLLHYNVLVFSSCKGITL